MGCLLPNSDRQATYQDPTSAVTIDDPVNPVVIAEHLSLRDCELVTIHFQDCLKLLCLDQWQSVFYVDEQIDYAAAWRSVPVDLSPKRLQTLFLELSSEYLKARKIQSPQFPVT
ncbi:hypothetical protein SARC_01375 [Sphaeroforma arctica JP610]|uniref:Uncharacterized protein n=1 Tax=Sphaeroforma arctica JP610 TaxID=667725 RepID=A0A0L0GBU2_9EUKA|nr:hypothetical protein SARC_01375 [Sphaeroforma arctica JP610]KNC86465.1 hypothetical protein SARC_01375 [Sphaeroforma arctica JP610]|eukprot:XP_014160367.1 hypothetical protein SARC_01375 [Sphaeroforma arctica JP610]